MSIKKIKKHNDNLFLHDLNRVRDVMVYAPSSNVFLKITKKELRKEAETTKINYHINDKIFVRRREVMVIT
jgi:hypothetical protein